METIEALLGSSVAAYRDLLAAYGEVEKAVSAGGGVRELETIMARMEEAAQRAMNADARFQGTAAETGAEPSGTDLFEKWRALVEAAAKENERLGKYIKTAMAMTRADLSNLRKGKAAMPGYHGTRGYARTGDTGSRIRCGV